MRTMLKRGLLSGGLLLAVAASLPAKTPLMLSKTPHAEMEAWVDSVYNSMSVDQRVGQLIAQVFPAKNVAASKSEIAAVVKRYHIGWAYFSEGSAEAHAELANYVNSLSATPVAIALDGEWGLSMRMKDTPQFPRNMMLGAIQDDRLLYEYGREMARECREVGVNVNFAPSADVNSDPKNPVIGTRSFGENPVNVGRKTVAYSRGLEDGGVMAVAKHFPGHGDTHEDSHKTLPTVSRSLASIEATDLVPFRNFIDAGLGGVMVAHLSIPALGTGSGPASLSAEVTTALLKERMGFEGLVFTDALTMKGARANGEANGLAAFLAGADVLLEPYKIEQSFADLKAHYAKGGEQRAAIERACKKVLAYKYAMGLANRQPVEIDGLMERVCSRQAELMERKLYAAAMTVLKNSAGALPLKRLDRKVCVATAGADGDEAAPFLKACRLYTKISERRLSEGNAADWAADNPDAGAFVVGVYDSSSSTRRAVAELVGRAGGDRVVLVFFVKPYSLAGFAGAIADAAATVVAYETRDLAQDYAAQVVFGGSDATGRMPVSVEGVAKAGDGVDVMASRLGYEMPEAVDLDERLVFQVDSIVEEALRQKAFPGCQVLVARHGKVVINKAYGYLDPDHSDRVTTATLFDLASVSKATGTLSAVMKLVDDNRMSLSAKISEYIPELAGDPKGELTIRDFLYHETGLQPSLNVYEMMTDSTSYEGRLASPRRRPGFSRYAGGAYIANSARLRADIASTRATDEFPVRIGKKLYVGQTTADSIMRAIYALPQRDDRRYVYSCINFCLLRQAEENITGVRHDRFVSDSVFRPIGAYSAVYRPLDTFDKDQIAATEIDDYFRGGLVQGVVHDETAAFSGGIQGNAGLFANANDVAKLCQMWLNGGMYGGERILSAATVGTFLSAKSPNSHRGLGFDKPNPANPDASNVCPEASPEVVGHTGFTGTSFWVDPAEGLIYVFLSNRVSPSRNNPAFSRVGARFNIFSYVYQSIARASQNAKGE